MKWDMIKELRRVQDEGRSRQDEGRKGKTKEGSTG
jgi:hypothetical protein